jgi:hypothetical protein
MSSTTQRDNFGYLTRSFKQHPNSPDMAGEAWVDGKRYEIVGWVNLSKKGKKYLNLKFIFVPKVKKYLHHEK